MFLQRMNRAETFNQVRREMDRLFGDFLPDFEASRAFPPLNVWEDGDKFFVEAEVPGFQMENIDIEVKSNELAIRGRRESSSQENVKYHQRERSIAEFSRSVTLPTAIDTAQVQATIKNGVLLVTLPKAETAKVKKVEVKGE